MKHNIYSPSLETEIKKNRMIPRRINENEHLKIYHKYFIPEIGVCKVESIELINETEYYFIKYGNYNGCIPYPIDSRREVYELLHNYESLENDNIFNSTKAYSGAEIKYWFIVNDINENLFIKYWKYLNPISENYLIDNKLYHVVCDKKHKEYKIILYSKLNQLI